MQPYVIYYPNYIFKFVAKIDMLFNKVKTLRNKMKVSLNSLVPFIKFDFSKSATIWVKRRQLNHSNILL